ncbi:hypothetical protein PIB30_071157 [Stylosanthes scabra]|uniref:Uncharacterized protein n=1 Tax=Stylosanthes scabra TaxID=79078 RepID=A0ABU6VS21_9FABA|nr:hypothetical protein [Stylosanthes scabra]
MDDEGVQETGGISNQKKRVTDTFDFTLNDAITEKYRRNNYQAVRIGDTFNNGRYVVQRKTSPLPILNQEFEIEIFFESRSIVVTTPDASVLPSTAGQITLCIQTHVASSCMDMSIGSAVVSAFDAEEQVEEEPDEDKLVFDDYFMSFTPTADGLAQTQGNAGNGTAFSVDHGTASSVDHGTSSRRLSGKKMKQVDILKRMADEVHESTVAQREHVQILANVIFRNNEEVKIGEKLEELGFADHDAFHVVVKICFDPRLEKSFWGMTDAQNTTLA